MLFPLDLLRLSCRTGCTLVILIKQLLIIPIWWRYLSDSGWLTQGGGDPCAGGPGREEAQHWTLLSRRYVHAHARKKYSVHTDKKENKNFLLYKEIQMGAVAKSYMTNGLIIYLSYIYLGSSVCLSSCHIPVILSSCHICGTLSYSLCFSKQTDQGDKMEGFEREGLEIKR
jgi:hypothetical protein